MTAGRGLIHSEMPEQSEGEMRGFQLWVNLPATHKMMAPRYQDIEPERVPVCTPVPGARLRVIAGNVLGVEGPVDGIVTKPIFIDIALDAGARLSLPVPATHTAFVYPFEGAELVLGSSSLPLGELGVLDQGDSVELSAPSGTVRMILAAAAPLREPVARWGPFVMNTEAEIRQAIADYRSGRL